MKVRELVSSFEALAPTKWAESWDNVGLLAGDLEQEVRGVGFTIDLTNEVLDELESKGCNVVYAYHPPIFKPLKRLATSNPAVRAIARGIALYSPHTALDVAPGGTNDVLADILALTERSPLTIAPGEDDAVKLVTFVPARTDDGVDVLERVADALFDAGAGHIGDYSACSFRLRGEGTFLGGETTSPTIGARGVRERVEETRLEVVVPLARVAPVLQALRRAHPYEEPAFDLIKLAAAPKDVGMGRVGTRPRASLAELVGLLKKGLGIEHLLVAGREGPFERIAVAAGSAGSLYRDARKMGAELFVTGEMRHHDVLDALSLGLSVVCVLHSNSERVTLEHVKRRLAAKHEGVLFCVAERDQDPLRVR